MIKEGPKELVKFVELMSVMKNLRITVRYQFIKNMKDHKLDLTLEMLEVLTVLWEKDELNQQEIAHAVNRNKASLTSLIDNLVQRGLVSRQPDAHDRRNNLIVLSKEGLNYQRKVTPLLNEMYEKLLTGIPLHQIDDATKLLQTIYDRAVL